MAQKIKKPFNVKGKSIVSFLGESEWCKILPKQMETRFTPRGQYSVNLVTDPDAEDFLEFKGKIEAIINQAQQELMNDEGPMKVTASKKKNLIVAYPWKDHVEKEKDDDGNWTIENETGKILIQPKMKNVLDKPDNRNTVQLRGDGNAVIPIDTAPEIGNGSKIKAKMYVNPYYMPSTNTLGVSLNLEAVKVYELVEYGSNSDGEDFDDDGGADLGSSDTYDSDEEDF